MAESSAGLCACGKPGCSDGSDLRVDPIRGGVVPGTLAMVRIGRFTYGPALWDEFNGQWVDHKKGRLHPGGIVPEVRPLLVIDPEDREQVERLLKVYYHETGENTECMQAALRELITPPKPPIPECPEGCMVVVDKDGDTWVIDGGGWLCNSSLSALAWPDLWTEYGPLRSVGPIIGSGSAGVGEAE